MCTDSEEDQPEGTPSRDLVHCSGSLPYHQATRSSHRLQHMEPRQRHFSYLSIRVLYEKTERVVYTRNMSLEYRYLDQGHARE